MRYASCCFIFYFSVLFKCFHYSALESQIYIACYLVGSFLFSHLTQMRGFLCWFLQLKKSMFVKVVYLEKLLVNLSLLEGTGGSC